MTGIGDGYHLYELIFNPGAGSAELFVDGVSRFSGFTGALNPGLKAVTFGGPDSRNTGQGNYNLVQFEIAALPFAAFDAKVEIDDDEFEVMGTFTLGADSDGIDIPTEIVSLQLTGGTGAFSATIPAGSFEQDEEGEFKFEGIIDGVALEVKITSLGNGDFEFKAEGEGVDLTGIANPVTVNLTIGDDGGSTAVAAEIEGADDDNGEGD